MDDDTGACSPAGTARGWAAGLAARVPATAVQEMARRFAATGGVESGARPRDRIPVRAARQALGRLYEWELAALRHRTNDLARSTWRLAETLAERFDRLEAAQAARLSALQAEAAALSSRLDQLECTTGRPRP